MSEIVIHNVEIVNEGERYLGGVHIVKDTIKKVFKGSVPKQLSEITNKLDGNGNILMPGCIDDQVHFREPGLTQKAEIFTESRAAVAGGITSFMEMPNTVPQTTTQKLLEEKYQIASEKSLANYSFYIGATNNNVEELLKTDPKKVCGIKIFMGSSTGNMLVDDADTLNKIFAESNMLIATHCEYEPTIQTNLKSYMQKYGDDIPIVYHPEIRSAEACYASSSIAVELATKYNTRLHVLHISTEQELSLFNSDPLSQAKKITAEVCIHHLWFDNSDYLDKGTFIKWNPAIKSITDKNALQQGLLNNTIDVVATDHAPHTLEEKKNVYTQAPSGGPLVQHALPVMLEFYHKGQMSLEQIAQKMAHNPAILFHIEKRGFIREGYKADLVLVDLYNPWTVAHDNILYKCKWSPFEGIEFLSRIAHTFVNGNLVYTNGIIDENSRGDRLLFNT